MMKPQVKANPQKHFILANQALRATLSPTLQFGISLVAFIIYLFAIPL